MSRGERGMRLRPGDMGGQVLLTTTDGAFLGDSYPFKHVFC